MINAVASSSGAARMTMPGRSSGRAWWDLRSSCRSDSRLLIAIPFGITLARGQLTAPADEKEILRHGRGYGGCRSVPAGVVAVKTAVSHGVEPARLARHRRPRILGEAGINMAYLAEVTGQPPDSVDSPNRGAA